MVTAFWSGVGTRGWSEVAEACYISVSCGIIGTRLDQGQEMSRKGVIVYHKEGKTFFDLTLF